MTSSLYMRIASSSFIFLSLLFMGVTQAQTQPLTLRMGHILNDTSLYHISLTKFGEALAKNSGGRLKVEIFPNGTLGFERDLIEGMRLGTIDGGVITSAPIAGFEPRMMVLDLPFIFKSREGAFKVMDGEVGRRLFGYLEAQNLKGLAFFDAGWRAVISTKKALVKPEDYAGSRFRVLESPLYVATFKSLGVNPTPMNFGEVYTGLRQGTIDSLDLPIYVVQQAKINEVAKYMALTEHMLTPVVLMMSKSKFESLSADLQQIVVKTAQDTKVIQRQIAFETNRDVLNKLRELKMEIVAVPDKRGFQEKMQSVYREFEDKIGKDLIQAVQSGQ
ncbi:MAG: DctP family TRAP transporter solute-binding subunit [Burkholderiaceae bacterium]